MVVDLDYEQYFVSVFGVTETNYTVKATTDGAGARWRCRAGASGPDLARVT